VSAAEGTPVVLVVVGTDCHPFDRLVDWVERWSEARAGVVRCVVQHGSSRAPRTAVARPYLGYAELQDAMAEAAAVVNLVGAFSGNLDALQGRGAGRVAAAAKEAGARAFVHISANGADANSAVEYSRTKAEGEQAVRAAFPGATIMRPSALFGREDNFVNRFAGMSRLAPVLPVIRGGTRLQPVYAADVGRAVAAAANAPREHGGKTYELGGPQVMTMRELMELVCKATGHQRSLVDVPDAAAAALARLTGWLPGAPLTWEQWLMLQKDSVVSGRNGLEAFGLPGTPLAAVSEGWLTAYRRHGRFAAKSPY